jgi:hypothetical protein
MASNFIDELNSLYVNRVFLKENVASGIGPNVDSPSEGKAEDYEAPHRDCLCNDEDDECSCHDDKKPGEDDMVFAKNEPHGGYDREEGHEQHETNAYMAKQQLYRAVKMASMLHDIINDDEELEPWMASKITQAFDDLNSIFGYKDYQHFRDKIDHDIEIEEKTEQDLYKSIDQGGETLINKIKDLMRGQPKEKVEGAVYGMIKMLEA